MPALPPPTYAGIIRQAGSPVVPWDLVGGTNRGYLVANASTGEIMPVVLIDDTDPTRQQDFKAACSTGRYTMVFVTIGQGEPASTRFTCPPGSRARGVGLREWYPFWSGRLQLPYSWFPCVGGGWISQSPNWGWGGFAGDNGADPASSTQSASEYATLARTCPRLVEGTF